MSMYGNHSPTRIVTHDMSDKIDMAYSAIIQQANEETAPITLAPNPRAHLKMT
jgi:hypothetical protein